MPWLPLPPALNAALGELAGAAEPRRLADNVEWLQELYRSPGTDLAAARRFRRDEVAAYAVYRMPATYAATRAALQELAASDPGFAPSTLLDIGGGSGAAIWAAADAFDSLTGVTVIDRDAAMTDVARRLAAASPFPAVREALWTSADVTCLPELPAADLAIASYALGEMPVAALEAVVGRLAEAATTVLLVEPGTPRGFATVRAVRTLLIAAGRAIAAPCPHDSGCPMAGDDWCHVATRLPRSAAHRRAKGGQLGYEDEKFSYVAATTRSVAPAASRVLRHPQVRSGHVMLRLCTRDDGLSDVTVASRHGGRYKSARTAQWGDRWPADGTPAR